VAQLVGVLGLSHSPACYLPPERWSELRRGRNHRGDVPLETDDDCRAKARRIQEALHTLRERLSAVRPDVLIVFGDDHYEQFSFAAYPSLGVLVGSKFWGYSGLPASPKDIGRTMTETPRCDIPGATSLASSILASLLREGFDPTFVTEFDQNGGGLGHAILRPLLSLTDLSIPIVPILLNCYFPPQVTGRRAYQIGVAVGDAIRRAPGNERVAVIGSGGLWHTPGCGASYIDEAFDERMLAAFCAGAPSQMAETFDAYSPLSDDQSQTTRPHNLPTSGMATLGGPQGGTRETCNWIAAAATADGTPGELVDYVPVYASPVGLGFAHLHVKEDCNAK
jgi:aromatic ring-opening dioxygenase catalytic subunit (LigB family)